MSILFFLSLIFPLEELSYLDLQNNENFLVFLYYSKNDFYCPSCAYYKDFLHKIETKVKTLNFSKDPYLASKFLQYTFPSFIYKENENYFLLKPRDGNELVEICNDFTSYKDLENYVVPYGYNINSIYMRFVNIINLSLYRLIDLYYRVIKYMPQHFLFVFYLITLLYLVYCLISIFKEDIKVKQE